MFLWLVQLCLEHWSLKENAEFEIEDIRAEVETAKEPAVNCRPRDISCLAGWTQTSATNNSTKAKKAGHITHPARGVVAAIKAHLAEAQSGPLSSPTAAGDAAGGIGDKHEQQLRTSITEKQLKELRAEHQQMQLDMEADCVARIAAVKTSCTIQIALLASSMQKAAAVWAAAAYEAGYQAGLMEAAAATAAPSGAQCSPSTAHGATATAAADATAMPGAGCSATAAAVAAGLSSAAEQLTAGTGARMWGFMQYSGLCREESIISPGYRWFAADSESRHSTSSPGLLMAPGPYRMAAALAVGAEQAASAADATVATTAMGAAAGSAGMGFEWQPIANIRSVLGGGGGVWEGVGWSIGDSPVGSCRGTSRRRLFA